MKKILKLEIYLGDLRNENNNFIETDFIFYVD